MRIKARRSSDRVDETGTAAVATSSDEEATHPSLVSLLVEARVASESNLQQMAGEADALGIGLGELVVTRGLLDEEAMARLVARQWELPFLARGSLTMDPTAAGLLAFEQASTLHGCAIGIRDGGLLVVVDDPRRERLDALRAQVEKARAGTPVSFAVVTASSLKGLLGQLARLSGRRPDPDPNRSPLASAAQPTAKRRTEQNGSRPTSSDRLLADLQQAAATEQALQARLDQLEAEREAANERIEQLQQQIEHLEQQREAADRGQPSERDDDSELQARLDQLESERDAANQKIADLQQQIEQLQEQLEAVDQERVSERDHGSQLQARLDQLETEQEAANQQIEQLQQQLEARDEQQASELERSSELQARLDQLETERTAAEQQLEQLRQQLGTAGQEQASERDHSSELQARLDQLEHDHTAAEQQVEQLQQQLVAADQQRASERDHGSQLQARLDQLETERETANQQIEQLQQQLEAAGRQQASERDHESELQARLDQLESEREAANQQIEQFQQQIDQLQQQLAAADQPPVSESDPDSETQSRPNGRRKIQKHRDQEVRRQIHELLSQTDSPNRTTNEEMEMAGEVPLINVRLIEGVFSPDERRELAKGLITAVIGVKGESFRDGTEVLIAEVPVGNRGEARTAMAPEEVGEPA
jgi:chromosome segregation ATPase